MPSTPRYATTNVIVSTDNYDYTTINSIKITSTKHAQLFPQRIAEFKFDNKQNPLPTTHMLENYLFYFPFAPLHNIIYSHLTYFNTDGSIFETHVASSMFEYTNFGLPSKQKINNPNAEIEFLDDKAEVSYQYK